MKAREISEAVANLRPVAQSPAGTWYETSAAKVKAWFKQMHGAIPRMEKDPGVRVFVFVPEGSKLWSYNNRAVQLHHTDLISVESTGTFYTHKDAQALQSLADATPAKNGDDIWGDFILYQGKVHPEHEFLQTLPVVTQISTGAVHEVPSDAFWTLGKVYLKHQISADRVLVFRSTSSDVSLPWCAVSIRDGKMSDIQSQGKLDKVTQVKLSKELASALGMEQKVTVATHIIPESKTHLMLKAIQENPGVERWKLYWDVLKLKKLPKYRSEQDVASELVSLKLVQEVHDPAQPYPELHITSIGKLVLARVNAGKSVAKASLIKQ